MNHAIVRLSRVLGAVLFIATAVSLAHAEPQVVREPVKLRSTDSMNSPVFRVLRRKTRVETLGDISSKTGYVRVRTCRFSRPFPPACSQGFPPGLGAA